MKQHRLAMTASALALGGLAIGLSQERRLAAAEAGDAAPATSFSRGAGAHPNFQMVEELGFADLTQAPTALSEEGVSAGDAPPDSPLVSGEFVNFESPPVKALALSPDGSRLYAVNTPNNSLVVLDTSSIPMNAVAEIPVGLEPVSAAVQPGTGGDIVWVANFISDNVSVVDAAQGRVIDIVEIGDEPVRILFDDAGDHAFIVVQGTPSVLDTSAGAPSGIMQEGALVAVDAGTRTILRSLYLDMHTPRAADWVDGRIAVAALHSGNNTTLVGKPMVLEIQDAETGEPENPLPVTGLQIVQFFDETAPLFADPLLSPWPDSGAEGTGPLVHRIVPDAGEPSAWADIVETLSTPDGQPDPAMAQALKDQLEAFFQGSLIFTNVAEVIGEIIDDAKDTVDHDVALVDPQTLLSPSEGPAAPTMLPNVGTTLTALAVNPVSEDLFVANMEPRNLTRHEPDLRGAFMEHQISIVDPFGGSATPVDLHAAVPNFDDASAANPDAQAASLANPVDVVFRSDGARAYVASLGTGRVGVLDGATADVLGIVDVGGGTRSLALDESSNRLYAFNRTDMTVVAVDVSTDAPSVTGVTPLFNPEPPSVRDGREFLYSTRFSNNFSSSCAMCHIDGRLDHLSWDLGAPEAGLQPTPHVVVGGQDVCSSGAGQNHPLKGPMVTLSLQGLKDHAPLHWRGDRPEFQSFNPAFDVLLGGSELSQEQMDAYAAFVDSIAYPPNPYRNRDNTTIDPGAQVGRTVFMNSCNGCHQVTNDGAMTFDCIEGDAGFNLGGIFAQVQLTTQLRGLHRKLNSDRYTGFGLIHDGREEREGNSDPLDTFLQDFFPGIINADLDEELKAFVVAFPSNAMPVIGSQALVAGAPTIAENEAIDLMIQQHALTPSRADVVAKGVIEGEQRGFALVDPLGPTFESDEEETLSLGELFGLLSGGDSLTFTAVPPGSGERIGVNQDLDCDPDGLDPFPQKNIDLNLDGVVDGADLGLLLLAWGPDGALSPADFDNEGGVNGEDLGTMLLAWGTCP